MKVLRDTEGIAPTEMSRVDSPPDPAAIHGRVTFGRLANRHILTSVRYRAAVPLFLLVAGAVAVGCIFLAESVTWKAVWIGVANTALATGFVDGSAILETRERERAVVGFVSTA
jgi:hypothetical protein